MKRVSVACLAAAASAALAACGGSNGSQPTPVPSATPPGASCPTGAPVAGIPALTARLVVSGLRNPLDLQVAPGDRERLYVVEQGGRIRVVRDGQLQAAPFLDISGRILSGGERGLLGLAFHPQFATNRRFFVNYTDPRGDTHVAEFRAGSADAADPSSERLVLFQAQPFPNHNGGGLAFDNGGRLLIALGDGGSAGDPLGNGQRLDTFLGKILRVDVDAGAPYAVPADNPFRSTAGAAPEIWAYGLRNPYRISVDRPTGDLYIGDVGQGAVEEIDVQAAASRGGLNYGWNVLEGSRCFSPFERLRSHRARAPRLRVHARRGLLGDGRGRVPRLPDAGPRRDVLLRGLLQRLRPVPPLRERPGDRRADLDGAARHRLSLVLRAGCRGRGLRRGPGRRGLPPRAGQLRARRPGTIEACRVRRSRRT